MKSLVAPRTALAAAALMAGAAAAHAEPAVYAIDPTHTFANFEIGHMGTSTIRVRFDRKQGQVELDRVAKTGKVDLTIDTASVSSGVPPFDAHLKSADLFDVARHPTARFVGDRFSFEGDKVTAVAGTLTLLGKTQPLTLKATRFNCYMSPMLKRDVCGGDFEATIERSQWGMTYALQMGAPDQVRLLVQVEAVRQ